jgi:hypothetical protein
VNVELRKITSETVRAIYELEVAADERAFVAPNAVSIAEAHFTPVRYLSSPCTPRLPGSTAAHARAPARHVLCAGGHPDRAARRRDGRVGGGRVRVRTALAAAERANDDLWHANALAA